MIYISSAVTIADVKKTGESQSVARLDQTSLLFFPEDIGGDDIRLHGIESNHRIDLRLVDPIWKRKFLDHADDPDGHWTVSDHAIDTE